MKVCKKCQEEKPLTEFYAAKSAADGRQTYCKACSRVKSMEWRAANIERARGREAAWRAANIEKVSAYNAKWRAENTEKVSAYNAKWRAENSEEASARVRAWQAANPDKVKAIRDRLRAKKLAAKAAWFEANKDAITRPIKTPEEW